MPDERSQWESSGGEKNRGYVFNIQHYSVHDGPGIRTIVFLKGCPLRCQWCSNPESQSALPELAYNSNKCIGLEQCGLCLAVCPAGALQSGTEGKISIDRGQCQVCLRCIDVCPSRALSVFGRLMSAGEVLDIVEKDGIFYSRSAGGLTVSGGEPLAQPRFLEELLREARRRRINTTLETSGYAVGDDLLAVAGYLDSIFYDIKCLDKEKHKQYTGVDNERIIANLFGLRERFPALPITVRTPVVPGFNDTPDDITAIARLVKQLPGVEYELLGYHRLGEPKYGYIGREYALPGVSPLAREKLQELRQLARNILDGK
ncbi:MAG: (2S)-3-sulfopropanediol dehydratase activating enzyme [Desulfurispora sp.]|uniref:(2S)-3-sulfopropanediol dehydratase activating enzyme n=1 Tax=Desulfurispora sp. TaxID=3014275 RepID=UPI00404963B7